MPALFVDTLDPSLQHQLQRDCKTVPRFDQRNHFELAHRFCNLRNHGTLHDTVLTDCDFTAREPLPIRLLPEPQDFLRLLPEPFDIADCHTQEDLGAKGVNICALYRCAMPDYSPLFALAYKWLL